MQFRRFIFFLMDVPINFGRDMSLPSLQKYTKTWTWFGTIMRLITAKGQWMVLVERAKAWCLGECYPGKSLLTLLENLPHLLIRLVMFNVYISQLMKLWMSRILYKIFRQFQGHTRLYEDFVNMVCRIINCIT